jgi:tetratricopeptide (TPR) repeat protein
MESGRPSKEQIDYYYKTSRKYFDSLALKYLQEDKAFYNNYFAHYYHGKPKTQYPAKLKALIFAGIIFLFVSGIFVLTLFLKKEPKVYSLDNNITEKKPLSNIEKLSENQLDSMNLSYMKTDFEKGTYFYSLGEYDKAKPYFEKVEKSDSDYQFAQDVLKSIERKKSALKNK